MLRPSRHDLILERRQHLPVNAHKREFLHLLDSQQCMVLIGETGAGKTTQIPQWCVEYLRNKHPDIGQEFLKVVCTQPRRFAAISVARRVAEEMNVELGSSVGYSVRFDTCTSKKTRLKFVTDGLLMRELIYHQNFEPYGIVILDEAHERSLHSKAMEVRKDLKVIIMSATIHADVICQYFTGCTILEMPGRLFDYLGDSPYFDAAVSVAYSIHTTKPPGDILIFLTGEKEIEKACILIRQKVASIERIVGPLLVLPLYSVLSRDDQEKVLEPAPVDTLGRGRKCIVSTNIAETSLTIDGIVYVIDSGYSKQKIFSPNLQIELSDTVPISKASANQRAGRAGRTAGGQCFRLYSSQFYENMQEYTTPEIEKCDFSIVALVLKRMGVTDLSDFPYIAPPSPESITHAAELLYELGAINSNEELTVEGILLSEFPVDPPLCKMLVTSAKKYGCREEILTLVSMLSTSPLFSRPFDKKDEANNAHQQFVHDDGDHLTFINIYNAFVSNGENSDWCNSNFLHYEALENASKIRKELAIVMNRFLLVTSSLTQTSPTYSINICKCILEGFYSQIATRHNQNYYASLKEDQNKILVDSSSLTERGKYEWVVYYVLKRTEMKRYRKKQDFIRIVSVIDPKWLFETTPNYYKDLNKFPPIIKEKLSNVRDYVAIQILNDHLSQ